MERGQDYTVEIDAVRVGKLSNLELDKELELIDTNNFDSPDWASSLVGMASASLDIEAMYVHGDAGQEALMAASEQRVTPPTIKLTSAAGTDGVKEWEGTAWVTSVNLSFGMNEVVTASFTLTFTEAITRTEIVAAT